MRTAEQKYKEWVESPYIDDETRRELEGIKDDEKEIEDRFYRELTFGTGGLRGEIGAGTNRINRYVVRKATQGLANSLLKKGEDVKRRGVVIAYDSRHRSPEFAEEAGLVLAKNGIKAYVFDALRPTPELSFAVRFLNAAAGIVITASHNPPEYNGYKVYDEDGCQLVPALADQVVAEADRLGSPLSISVADKEQAVRDGLYEEIGQELDDAYNERLKTIVLNPDVIQRMSNDVKIIYTPLHGTGNRPVRRILQDVGFAHVSVIAEQENPDPEFSTVTSPNPEEHAAFKLALERAEREKPDLILGTDPDTDRVGLVVQNTNGQYVVLNGNQTGALMLEYILSQRKEKGTLPENGALLKTIVSSELGTQIASAYGVKTIDTLTGFKFIGEKIREFERTDEHRFLFGYEESYGYLIGDFVRDKDAVQACLLAAEMTAYYKSGGKTLYEQLLQLDERYGYYREELVSVTLKGKEGQEKIGKMLDSLRAQPPKTIASLPVRWFEDYRISERKQLQSGEKERIHLPQSNVLKMILEDESWFCIRPSGTEPKVKIYFSVKGKDAADADYRLRELKGYMMEYLNLSY